jgi:hypothetical protein
MVVTSNYFCHLTCFLPCVRPNSNTYFIVIPSNQNVVLFYIGLYLANMCYILTVCSTYPKFLQLMSSQEFLLHMYTTLVLIITYFEYSFLPLLPLSVVNYNPLLIFCWHFSLNLSYLKETLLFRKTENKNYVSSCLLQKFVTGLHMQRKL